METAKEVLREFLMNLDIGDGYKEMAGLSSDSDSAASRTYFGPDRRTATFRVTRSESASKARDYIQFEFDKRYRSRKQRRLPIEKLDWGELSFLYQDRYTEWEGMAVKGPWSCYVGRGYKQLWHGHDARETAAKDLRALFAVLPGADVESQPKSLNAVDVKPDVNCTEELRRMLSTPLTGLSTGELERLTKESGAAAQGEFQTQTHTPTPVSFLARHRAARATRLSPEIVAAAILSEVRGLDTRVFTEPFVEQLTHKLQDKIIEKAAGNMDWSDSIGMSRYLALTAVSYLGVPFVLDEVRRAEGWGQWIGVEFDETWRDWALAFFSDDVSVGPGQRQVNSLIDMRVHDHFPELANLTVCP